MRIQRSAWACRFAVGAACLVGVESLRGQTAPDDSRALNLIFGDEHLAAGVIEICARATDLPSDERYDFLADRVLPRDRRSTFRVVVDFSPTHPVPTAGDSEATGFRVPVGGEIISPALDLIDTAASLGRLDEFRRRVEATTATSVQSHIDRLALLALVEMAREDVPSAQSNLSALFALVAPEVDTAPRRLDPLLLCVHAAADHPALSLAIVDAAYRIVQSYQDVYERTAWQRQYSAAFARVQQAAGVVDDDTASDRAMMPFARWTSAGPPRARNRGAGFPVARWVMTTGQADNLFSHDQDFLYFCVPLRGNYEVECDVTGFGWRDSHLLVAGNWVAPVYDHESYDLGDIDGSASRIRFAPPLTKVGDDIHYRTVVRDSIATTYFNGRPIHSERLTPDHDPWLAVRSASRQDGGVRNLRITGDPVVPDELRLSSSPDLKGWIPYYDEVVGIDWRNRDGDGGGEIRARHQREFPRGSAQESALFYHRPMLEDGSIEYEFWYDVGECKAHPILDRLCFLLDPNGVKLHWLTDGSFDRTKPGPENLIDEPENRRGPGPLPLHNGDWNHLRLTIRGDTADLLLNDELVYQRRLEPTNQRNFGLFHYADQTKLRVRNVIWAGDWSREIPGLDDQDLVLDETGFLDERLPELTAVFSHDFAADGLPLEQFAVVRGDHSSHINPGPDGLLLTRQAAGGYQNSTVAPNLTVSGDFDITATFDQLASDPRESGSSNVFLLTIIDNEEADECMIIRRHTLVQGSDDQVIQCARVSRPDGQDRRHYFARHSVEARAGTFRLARRGERVYYMFAENDSRQFRLIGEESCPTDDLQLQGIRLIAQIHGDSGSTSIVWKSMSVRAESLSGPAVNADESPLLDLNRERNGLAQSITRDFTRKPSDAAVIRRWTDLRKWNPADDGLLIVAPGTDNWTSAGAALQRQIEGDFDVSIRFDPQRLDAPAEGQVTSVYLQVELADVGATQLSLIFQRLGEDATEVLAQLSVDNGQSVRNYRRLGRVGATSVQGLRLARRGRQLTCIVLAEELGGEVIVAQADVGDAPVPFDCTRIMVHTGGAGRESRIVWKSLDVHAERIVE